MSSPRPELRLDWATHEAAAYATRHWHYSHTMPAGKTVKVGVWESARFIGCIVFSRGANNHIGSPYGLKVTEVCELARVALRDHATPVSRILAVAMRVLKRQSPGLRLIVSYAYESRGHHGGIYQAGGWVYTGTVDQTCLQIKGRRVHKRTVGGRYQTHSVKWLRANVDRNARWVPSGVKHRYLLPLDDELRERIEQFRQPYPKRAKQATDVTNVPAAVQPRPARST